MLVKSCIGIVFIAGLVAYGCGKKNDDDNATTTVGTFTLTGGSAATATIRLAGVDASAAKMIVYKFAVSKNKDCSDPKIVIDNGDSPEVADMFKGPSLGSGKLEDGEYPCAIIEMADSLAFTPKEDNGACKQGAENNIDICGPRGDDAVAPKTKLLDGTEVACTAKTDRVGLYLSTDSVVANGIDAACEADQENCNAFLPPTSAIKVRGIKLANALVVKGDTAGVFVLDLAGKISGMKEDGSISEYCDLTPPGFSFKI